MLAASGGCKLGADCDSGFITLVKRSRGMWGEDVTGIPRLSNLSLMLDELPTFLTERARRETRLLLKA